MEAGGPCGLPVQWEPKTYVSHAALFHLLGHNPIRWAPTPNFDDYLSMFGSFKIQILSPEDIFSSYSRWWAPFHTLYLRFEFHTTLPSSPRLAWSFQTWLAAQVGGGNRRGGGPKWRGVLPGGFPPGSAKTAASHQCY